MPSLGATLGVPSGHGLQARTAAARVGPGTAGTPAGRRLSGAGGARTSSQRSHTRAMTSWARSSASRASAQHRLRASTRRGCSRSQYATRSADGTLMQVYPSLPPGPGGRCRRVYTREDDGSLQAFLPATTRATGTTACWTHFGTQQRAPGRNAADINGRKGLVEETCGTDGRPPCHSHARGHRSSLVALTNQTLITALSCFASPSSTSRSASWALGTISPEACRVASTALVIVEQVQVEPNLGAVLEFRQEIERWSSAPAVRDLGGGAWPRSSSRPTPDARRASRPPRPFASRGAWCTALSSPRLGGRPTDARPQGRRPR